MNQTRLEDLPTDVIDNMNDDEYYRLRADTQELDKMERAVERLSDNPVDRALGRLVYGRAVEGECS